MRKLFNFIYLSDAEYSRRKCAKAEHKSEINRIMDKLQRAGRAMIRIDQRGGDDSRNYAA